MIKHLASLNKAKDEAKTVPTAAPVPPEEQPVPEATDPDENVKQDNPANESKPKLQFPDKLEDVNHEKQDMESTDFRDFSGAGTVGH